MKLNNINILGIIIARANSRRFKGKNLKKIGKFSLVEHVVKSAKKSAISDLIISTDSVKIGKLAKKQGASFFFKRPKNLCKDYANDVDIAKHGLNESEKFFKKKYDLIVYIQATSPFIDHKYINKGIKKIYESNLACVVSASKADKKFNYVMLKQKRNTVFYFTNINKPSLMHSQKLKNFLVPNGCFWIFKKTILHKGKTLYFEPFDTIEMPEKNSVDIDFPIDLEIAKLYKKFYKI